MLQNFKRTAWMMASLGILAGSAPAMAGDWREDWKAFAATTGDEGHAKWVELINTPEAKKLDADWAEFRGYTASSLITAATDLPPELKPGLVITKDNAGQFPWLAKYLPDFWAQRLNSEWFNTAQIRIVPTSHYYMQGSMLTATKAIAPGSLSVNELGELVGADGSLAALTTPGLPFIHPKNGPELNWLQTLHGVGVDDLYFNPVKMTACDKNNKAERNYVGQIWWRRMAGRTDDAPLGNIPSSEGAYEAGALLFTEPNDVRGLAGVRVRYASADRDDDFKVFIPSLRRTRILAGTNGQDPLAAGLELAWDEWRSHWMKIDARRYDYTMAGETFILAMPETGRAYDPLKLSENKCTVQSVDLELRPVWILEITDKTGTYQYSKKRIYVDKEIYYTQIQEAYDRSGKMFRIWDDSRDFDPGTGRMMWKNALVANVISQRVSVIDMTADWEGRAAMNNSLFDIDQLRSRK